MEPCPKPTTTKEYLDLDMPNRIQDAIDAARAGRATDTSKAIIKSAGKDSHHGN
jgi:hypothetical protein